MHRATTACALRRTTSRTRDTDGVPCQYHRLGGRFCSLGTLEAVSGWRSDAGSIPGAFLCTSPSGGPIFQLETAEATVGVLPDIESTDRSGDQVPPPPPPLPSPRQGVFLVGGGV